MKSLYAPLLSALLITLAPSAQATQISPAVQAPQAAAASAAAQTAAAQPDAAKPLTVLFHADDQDDVDHALGNIENLYKSLKPGQIADVEMVLNGSAPNRIDTTKPNLQSFNQYMKAIYGFFSHLFSGGQKASQQTALQRMQQLSEQHHTRFAVCANSMKALGISPSNLPPFATIVPAGVTEIAIKEQEGYAYLKP